MRNPMPRRKLNTVVRRDRNGYWLPAMIADRHTHAGTQYHTGHHGRVAATTDDVTAGGAPPATAARSRSATSTVRG
jgi:hypothetical protein